MKSFQFEIKNVIKFYVHMGLFSHAGLHMCIVAKQKHLGCKKVRGQSEATLQTGRRDQKV